MSSRIRGIALVCCLLVAATLFLAGVTGRGGSGLLFAVLGPVAILTAGLFVWAGRNDR